MLYCRCSSSGMFSLHELVLLLFLIEGMEKPSAMPIPAPSAMPKARLSIISPSATPSPTPIASPIQVPSVTSFLDFDRLSVVIFVPQPLMNHR